MSNTKSLLKLAEQKEIFRTFSEKKNSLIEAKNNDQSGTSSTLTEEESKLRYEKKTIKKLQSISEEASGFGSFKYHKHENVFDQEQQFCLLPEQINEAKKKLSSLHGKGFRRSFTIEDNYSMIAQKPKLKIVSVLLIVGLAVFIIFMMMFQSEPDSPKQLKKSKNRSNDDKKSKKVSK